MSAESINKLIADKEISKAELARRLGTSAQNVNNKLNRDNFTEIELVEIAEVLDMKLAFIPKDYVSPSCYVLDFPEEKKFTRKRKEDKIEKDENERKAIAKKGAETRKQNREEK